MAHVHAHVYANVYTHVYQMCIHMSVHMRAHVHTHVHTQVRAHHMCVHMCMPMSCPSTCQLEASSLPVPTDITVKPRSHRVDCFAAPTHPLWIDGPKPSARMERWNDARMERWPDARMEHSTTHHSTAQHSTPHHSATQRSAAQHTRLPVLPSRKKLPPSKSASLSKKSHELPKYRIYDSILPIMILAMIRY